MSSGSQFVTHEVLNQPPPLERFNLFDQDRALREAVEREAPGVDTSSLTAFGAWLGSPETIALGDSANRHPPELRSHDRFGRRIDEVVFHPAWHALLRRAVAERVHNRPWSKPGPGAHVLRAASAFLLNQVESGVCCPLAMTFASVPALRDTPALAKTWLPRILTADYDDRSAPASAKSGCLVGMAMTEKQGGSDVRANTCRAMPAGDEAFQLVGHKWFCSAPMSDSFLTLAYTEAGLSCFLVPRWLADNERNPMHIQRLKDKVGNRSNASAEIEYAGATGWLVGEDGRGISSIIKMVQHTRLDAALSAAGIMRQAVAQALHHAAYRSAFQRKLIDHPLMRNVLADLALESEAATVLVMRVAGAFDRSIDDPGEAALARLIMPIAKYWVCKRTPAVVVEALECLGGNGYVEEFILARLYREAPVNSVWEGSGNVICLDVLRAMAREPNAVEALLDEIALSRGGDVRLDRAATGLQQKLPDREDLDGEARRLVERMALVLTGALLVRHAPSEVADAFCAARLGDEAGNQFGTLPRTLALDSICSRARPVC